MSSVDLVEFLTARLDEDELWAREASRPSGESTAEGGVHWQWENEADQVVEPAPDRDEFVGGEVGFRVSLRSRETWPTTWSGELPQFAIPTAEEVPSAVGGHIIRHDPARVLAEVNAKRRALSEYEEAFAQRKELAGTPHSIEGSVRLLTSLRFVKLLALPYADHPDYDEAWRP